MKTVIAFTWLDLLVCAAFALPFVSELTLSLLNVISLQFDFSPIEVNSGAGSFFVNLAGFFGVLWNIAMLKSEASELHKVDLLARGWLIALIVYHVNLSGLSPVFMVFIVTEIIGGVYKVSWLRDKAATEINY